MNGEVKLCVYCGGDQHPAECGQPIDEDEGLPYIFFALVVAAVVFAVVSVAF